MTSLKFLHVQIHENKNNVKPLFFKSLKIANLKTSSCIKALAVPGHSLLWLYYSEYPACVTMILKGLWVSRVS